MAPAALAASGPILAQQATAAPRRAHRRRLRARGEVHDLQHHAAGVALGGPADLAAGRPVLVPGANRSRQRGVPGRSRQGDQGHLRPAGLRRRRRRARRGGRAASGRRWSGAVRTDVPSPDGKRSVFIRDWNLWVRDVATGKETQLTTDGVKDFGYATDNAGWTRSDRPIVVWSPDSKKIATFQQDQRKVGEMYLVSTDGRPSRRCRPGSTRCPGDEVVTMIERVVIDVDAAQGRRGCKMPPDQHRSTLCDDWRAAAASGPTCSGAPDGTQLAFVSTSRDHKQTHAARRRRGDRRSARRARGDGGDVLRIGQRPRQLALPAGLERGASGSPSATTGASSISTTCRRGKLKHQITTGEGNVTQLLRVDEKSRAAVLPRRSAARRGAIPYFRHFYRVGHRRREPGGC